MRPEMLIVAGPNGAGKSTLAYEYVEEYDWPYVSADLIAAGLRPDDPAAARIQAGRLFFKQLHELAEARQSFIVETTLSGKGFLRVIRRLRDQEYRVSIAFVFVGHPDLCIQRVAVRVQRGGHDVPQPDIIRRFYRSKANFWTHYRNEVDEWYVYRNSSEAGMKMIALGKREAVQILDDAGFASFMRDI
ncbi:MAG: zeta toxin family protein [Bacteroidota bacterium]